MHNLVILNVCATFIIFIRLLHLLAIILLYFDIIMYKINNYYKIISKYIEKTLHAQFIHSNVAANKLVSIYSEIAQLPNFITKFNALF